jgi:Fur family ferric uptake transcriptional regulator
MPAPASNATTSGTQHRALEGEPSMAIANPREGFKEFLVSKGLRVTNQRLAIFDAAFNHPDHFSGLVREVDVGRDYKYYMANVRARTFQAQLICVDCDKIFEVDAPFMEWYGKTVCDKRDMEPESQRLQVTARCRALQRGAHCPHAGTATGTSTRQK